MQKKVFLCLLFVTTSVNLFYAQTQVKDYTQEITNITNEINSLKAETTKLVKQNKELQDQYESLKSILDQYLSLNSGVSNYLTVLSIVLTLLAVALPFINLFTVILPNKKIRRKIKDISKTIPSMVDQSFEKYMINFEKKEADQIIDRFVSENNVGELSNFLFLNKYVLDEDQYRKIIEKINTGIEIVGDARIAIFSHLLDTDSSECRNFFRSVFEDQTSPYLEYAVKYFSIIDLKSNINYLEKVLTGRKDFENVLVSMYDEICSRYINTVLLKNKSKTDDLIGKEKISILLNNELIVEKFNKDNLTLYHNGFRDTFLSNDNELLFKPFVKETLMYKKHYLKK